VELIQNQRNPIAIDLRTKRLDIINKYMNKDRFTRIQYSAKAAGIANGWKKWIGENKGLQRLNTIEKKKMLELQFTNWISKDVTRKQMYGHLLPQYEQLYKEMTNLSKENSYFMEGFYGIEIVRFIRSFVPMINRAGSKEENAEIKETATMPKGRLENFIKESANALKGGIDGFFKDYNPTLDKEMFVLLMQIYYDNCDKSIIPAETETLLKSYRYNITALADDVYSKSIFLQQNKLSLMMEEGRMKEIASLKNDILFRLVKPILYNYMDKVSEKLKEYDNNIRQLDRLWTKALMEMQSEKTFYPDANLTLRVTYGKVDGYNPRDGVSYEYYTTIDGIMEKENPDVYDYAVDGKLKQLYINKDYGRYAMKNGQMPVAFVATNHSTGGNSGSPVLIGDGQLIGINFDRCWEGTMSDIQYDADQCRNISVDIRYCLFIIDKFAGAKHLIDEMTIVQ
jgi:hypothetical protein